MFRALNACLCVRVCVCVCVCVGKGLGRFADCDTQRPILCCGLVAVRLWMRSAAQ